VKSANEYADLFAVVAGLDRLHGDMSDLMGEVTALAEELRRTIRGQKAMTPDAFASLHRQLSWLAADVSRMAARVNIKVDHGS
jgi:hypothetical protein